MFPHCYFCLWEITRRTPFFVLNKQDPSSSYCGCCAVTTSYCVLTFRISSNLIAFLCYICFFRCDLKKKRKKKKRPLRQHTSFVRVFYVECSIMLLPSFISVPNLYEVVMEEKENLWKIEFCKASQCPYFSSWWHNKREFQKVIVDWKEDGGFAQKGSIQHVSSALNCSPVVSWVRLPTPWERPQGLVEREAAPCTTVSHSLSLWLWIGGSLSCALSRQVNQAHWSSFLDLQNWGCSPTFLRCPKLCNSVRVGSWCDGEL